MLSGQVKEIHVEDKRKRRDDDPLNKAGAKIRKANARLAFAFEMVAGAARRMRN